MRLSKRLVALLFCGAFVLMAGQPNNSNKGIIYTPSFTLEDIKVKKFVK